MSVAESAFEMEYSLEDGSDDLRTQFDEEFDDGLEIDENSLVDTPTDTYYVGCTSPGTVPYCC